MHLDYVYTHKLDCIFKFLKMSNIPSYVCLGVWRGGVVVRVSDLRLRR